MRLFAKIWKFRFHIGILAFGLFYYCSIKQKFNIDQHFSEPKNVDTTIARVVSKRFSKSGNHYILNYHYGEQEIDTRFDAGGEKLIIGSTIPIQILKSDPIKIRLLTLELPLSSELVALVDTLTFFDPITNEETTWLECKYSDDKIIRIDTISKNGTVILKRYIGRGGDVISSRILISSSYPIARD